jgi:hypothetical protein
VWGRENCITILQIGDVCYYGTYAFWCVGVCVCVCVLVGFYSCCIFKYDFVVYIYICIYMVHSIMSRGKMCLLFICESMFSIAYGVLYIYIYIYER